MTQAGETLGTWEKHTKGIGSKLLQKFGFKGRLGAKEDGIAQAIDVVVRPTRLGLGFGDEADQVPQPSSSSSSLGGAVTGGGGGAVKKKRKGEEEGAGGDRWKRSKYRSQEVDLTGKTLLNQIIASTTTTSSSSITSQQKSGEVVIDMRQKEVQILTDLSQGTMTQEDQEKEVEEEEEGAGGFGREVLTNLDLLAHSAEHQLALHHRLVLHTLEREKQLRLEREAVMRKAEEETAAMERAQQLLAALSLLNEAVTEAEGQGGQDKSVSAAKTILDRIQQVLYVLQQQKQGEEEGRGLVSSFLPAALTALFTTILTPPPATTTATMGENGHVESVRSMKDMIVRLHRLVAMKEEVATVLSSSPSSLTSTSVIQSILDQLLLPHARQFFQYYHSSYLPLVEEEQEEGKGRCVEGLSLMRWIFSPPAFDHFLLSVLLPRLIDSVQHLSPQVVQKKGLHRLVIPWLSACLIAGEEEGGRRRGVSFEEDDQRNRTRQQALERQLHQLFSVIRQRLVEIFPAPPPAPATATTKVDGGAVVEHLLPWKDLMDPSAWERLLLRIAFPALVHDLTTTSSSSSQQGIGRIIVSREGPPSVWLMGWKELLPAEHFLIALRGTVFVTWLKHLQSCLMKRHGHHHHHAAKHHTNRHDHHHNHRGHELQEEEEEEMLLPALASWYEAWIAWLPLHCQQHELFLDIRNLALDMMQDRLLYEEDKEKRFQEEVEEEEQVVEEEGRRREGLVKQLHSYDGFISHLQSQDLYSLLRDYKQKLSARKRLQEMGHKARPTSSEATTTFPSQPTFSSSIGVPTEAIGKARMRDLVASLAESQGLTLLPKLGKEREGQQVWTLGQSLIYFQDSVVFVLDSKDGSNNGGGGGETWRPITIEDLLRRS